MDHHGASLWKPLLVFTLFALAISLVGNSVFQRHKESIKRDSQNELGGIAELKTVQITNWMLERKSDAQSLRDDSVFVAAADHWLQQGSPNDDTRARLSERLTTKQRANEAFGYTSVSLFDTKATLRLSSATTGLALQKSEEEQFRISMRSGQITFSEIHRAKIHSGERVEIELWTPLTLFKNGKVKTIGAVLFRIDPYRFIFPLIDHWPTPSTSAENLLVRRDGDEVIFLNRLRHSDNTALFMRRPLSQSLLPAAMAAAGTVGMVEGVDYRGVPVVGVINQVPGTSWKMVSKIDQAEIYAPINSLARWVMALMLTLIGTGAGMVLVWRAKEKKEYESALNQHRLAKRLDYLSRNVNDIIVLADDEGRIVDFNDRALEAYGYSPQEFAKLKVYDLRDGNFAPEIAESFQKIRETGSLRLESRHRRSNGDDFPVEISVRSVNIDGRDFQQAIVRDISERKKAEEELLRGKMFIRQVIDSDPNWIFVKAAEGKFLLANEAMAKAFGLTTESIVGKYNWELTNNPEHLAEYDRANKEVFEKGQEWKALQRATLPDGKVHIFQTLRKTLAQDDGSISLLTIATDITELKEAEAKLESERTRLRTLVQTIPDLIWLKDPEGIYLGCNPQFERFFGAQEKDIIGRTDYHLVDTELAESCRKKDGEAVAAGKPFVSEEWITYPDNGERALLEVIRMPMRDDSGNPAGVMGIARNITERKRTEEELRFKNALLTTEHEVSIDGILVVDDNGNIVSHNRRFIEIWSPQDNLAAAGSDARTLLSVRDLMVDPEAFIQKLQYLHEHRNETSRDEIALRDGRVIEHYTSPMMGPHQEYFGRIWYFRDITELKLSEMNLARSYAQLQRLSLRMENAKAEERAKIALNLHDEMGATLAAMKMRISWLASKLPADSPHLLDEAARISGLVSDGIQTMHHIVTQLQPGLLGDVGLTEAIKDYVKKFRQHTNIECILILPDEELDLNDDQAMTIFRILQETLNNVVKHAKATRVRIRFMERAGSLVMEVKDNGIGFDTSSHKDQSFGLLGIRERALMVGGKARISSTPGKGTRVSVSITYPMIRMAEPDSNHVSAVPVQQQSLTLGVEP